MFKDLSEETMIVLVVIVLSFAFMAFIALSPSWESGAQTSREITELRDDVNGLRMEVNRLNDRAGFNAGLDPDSVVRRDSFDRRPSAGKGVKP